MTGYDDTDLVVEQQLQEHYQERYGQPPDVASFWTQLSPQLEGRTHSLSQRQRFFGRVRRSLSFQKEAAFAQEVPYGKMHNQRTRRIGVWAAVLLAFVLVGSMVLVFSIVAQKKHTSIGTLPPEKAAKAPDVPGIYLADVKGLPGGSDDYATTFSRLDEKSHALLWQQIVSNVGPTLVTSEDSVYGIRNDINAVKDRTSVFALNLNDGAMRWDTEVGSPDFLSGLAVTDKDVYVMSEVGKIYVLDRATGKTHRVVDTKQLGAQLTPSVSIVNGVAYGSTSDAFVAVDTRTSALLWSRPKDKALQAGVPIVIGDTVYMSASGESGLGAEQKSWGFSYAFDAKSGEQKWVYPCNNAGCDDLAVANGLVILNNGTSALNAKDGKEVWHVEPYNLSHTSMTVVGDKLYYADVENSPESTTKGELAVRSIATGQVLWKQNILIDVEAGAVKDGVIYGGAWAFGEPVQDLQIVAMRESDGKTLWLLNVGKFVKVYPRVWLVV